MLLYHEYYLKPVANRFVRKIWEVDNSHNKWAIDNQGIIPNGCFNLAIVKGKGAEALIGNQQFILHEGIYFCSQMNHKVIARFKAKT